MHLHRYFLWFMTLCWTTIVCSEDLRQVYELSLANDPVIQAAYASLQAKKQTVPEAIAQMVPNLSGNYTTSGVNSDPAFPGDMNNEYNTTSYSLTLNQPLFHPEHWAQLEQARHVVKGADATYLSAAQQLIIRVAQQYFAILGAEDELQFATGKRKAFERELEQTQQRFDVGLIAITDVQDSRARRDDALAKEIAAQNFVANQYEKLRQITGKLITKIAPFPPSKKLPLLPPNPNQQETWVTSAHNNNLDVIAAKEASQQFKAAIGTQVAGHYPKVDLQGSLQRNKGAPPFDDLAFSRNVTLNVTVPIFAGGGVYFRTQEASSLYEESLKKLESQLRAAEASTREAFRGILTSISGVQALAQAVISNKSALEATQAAYEVGTRTIVDVLDAQSNLLSAERDHAVARYNYLLQGLQLKQSSGILVSSDLYEVSDLMTGKATIDVDLKKAAPPKCEEPKQKKKNKKSNKKKE